MLHCITTSDPVAALCMLVVALAAVGTYVLQWLLWTYTLFDMATLDSHIACRGPHHTPKSKQLLQCINHLAGVAVLGMHATAIAALAAVSAAKTNSLVQ